MMKYLSDWAIIFFAWLISLTATTGSLFFSEAMDFIPCSLCWYQRIAMYPLSIILMVGMLPVDLNVKKYAFPFIIFGWLFSLVHILHQLGLLDRSLVPCRSELPCSIKYIEWFGFITIPILSFVAFSLIAFFIWNLGKRSA